MHSDEREDMVRMRQLWLDAAVLMTRMGDAPPERGCFWNSRIWHRERDHLIHYSY